MAQQGVYLSRDQFCCCICQDVLKDPVTIPCGHSYCMGCIKDCWYHDGHMSCPQCRETFNPRPALKKTIMLAEVTEQLMKTGLVKASTRRRDTELEQEIADLRRRATELEQEIADLRRRDTELEQLSHTQPNTRADFLQYYSQITLDPNTANTFLSLSEGNRKATCMHQKQGSQVLGTEGLTGRCYWEVEWSGGVDVAASYKDISRTGTGGKHSWALEYSLLGDYSFRHNNKRITVPGPQTSRIGVYLDHRAGTLSFYSVSDTMTLLHRVNTTFTQPLYPGLYVYHSGKAEFCELK